MEEYLLPRSRRVVSIPSSGEDWQLFTSMPCDCAARALTWGLKRALRAAERARASGTEPSAHELFRTYVEPPMDRYADCGARDTEPRATAHQALTRILRTLAA